MTPQTVWQCPTCDEQHEDQFDTCWKCGTNRIGGRNQNFRVSEPASENDQAPDSAGDDQLPTLQLPTITYFSIPPFIWLSLVNTFNDLQHWPNVAQIPDFSFSMTEIVVHVCATVLIGIPIFFTMVRMLFLCIMRRLQMPHRFPEALWMLSMFRLPVDLRLRHSWFVPVYYGSIIAMIILPFGIATWHVLRSIQMA